MPGREELACGTGIYRMALGSTPERDLRCGRGEFPAYGSDRLAVVHAACLGMAASEKKSLEHPYQAVSLLLPIHLHTPTPPCVMLI